MNEFLTYAIMLGTPIFAYVQFVITLIRITESKAITKVFV